MSSKATSRQFLKAVMAGLAGLIIAVGLGVSSPAYADVPSVGAKLAPAVQAADTSQVEPGVVRIDTTLNFQGAEGTGAGVVLSPDGIVLTNNHVIRGADGISVTNIGNGQTYQADVLGYDRKSDIAVLQLRGASNLPVAPTGDPALAGVGAPVTSVGFPGGGGLTRSPGTVRALNKRIVANDELDGTSEPLTNLIDFDADIQPGDSGGPLVSDSGQVVGIVTAASQNYKMMSTGGFAIPIDRALAISDSVRAGNASGTTHLGPTGILGVAVLSDRDRGGVPVDGVLRGGPADQAGVRGGDVITAVDGIPATDGTVLTDVLDGHHPGDTVALSYLDRHGKPQSTSVTLAPGPPN
jgi:serine protease Do